MALPLQLIIVGPLARLIFRTSFIRGKQENSTGDLQNEADRILEETM